MKRWMRYTLVTLVLIGAGVASGGGCSGDEDNTPAAQSQDRANAHAAEVNTYDPVNNVELDNYNRKLRLDDDPTTIIWCTAFPSSPNAPFVTVPIAGKLTSSSTSALSPEKEIDRGNYSWQSVPNTSVDGLYHPNPPPYRFGFTPGGQYVDFFNMDTFCTTKPLTFQRQSVQIDVDSGLNQASQQAQQALENNDPEAAQQALEQALNGG